MKVYGTPTTEAPVVWRPTTPEEFIAYGIQPIRYSNQLEVEVHNNTRVCPSGVGTLHYVTFTDKAGNTVDVYCKHNEWLEGNTSRQYTAYYNDVIVIGQCPYSFGLNTYIIKTDEYGIISETLWHSAATDGSGKSVEYRLEFN